jgi:hypothetical protein
MCGAHVSARCGTSTFCTLLRKRVQENRKASGKKVKLKSPEKRKVQHRPSTQQAQYASLNRRLIWAVRYTSLGFGSHPAGAIYRSARALLGLVGMRPTVGCGRVFF